MRGGSDPFSTDAADVLQNIFQTLPGDPLESGYTTILADVTAVLTSNMGNNLRLRFAEVDNFAPFQMGVDNVRIQAVPEPSLLAFLGLGGLALLLPCGRRCLRKRSSIDFQESIPFSEYRRRAVWKDFSSLSSGCSSGFTCGCRGVNPHRFQCNRSGAINWSVTAIPDGIGVFYELSETN